MDDGISIAVSFDGGNVFQSIPNIHEKLPVKSSTGKIQVKITFDTNKADDIYKIKTSGFFYNLGVGTTLFFTKISTKEIFSTSLGPNGKYSISLPRGTYEIWVKGTSSERTILSKSYNPELGVLDKKRIDKEAIIEMSMRDIDWVSYSVFDTFEDNRMEHGDALIDSDGDLSDGEFGMKCRYWSIGFD